MDAVANYLQFLKDPSKLRDEERIAALQRDIEDSNDVLTTLKLQAELVKAEGIDGQALEADFITHAKQYAEDNGLPAEAFKRMGVEDRVLQAAGVLPGADSKAVTTGRVKVEDVCKDLPPGEFTRQELQVRTGASIGTVIKALKQLVEAGTVKESDDPNHSGRGRAAKVYRRV